MNMKRSSLLFHVARVALFSAAVAPGLLRAQQSEAPPAGTTQESGPRPHGEHRDPAERQAHMVQTLTRRLNLSPDQVGQVKTIQAESQTQMQALRTGDTTPGPDRREKAMAIHKAQIEKLRAVLNDEQRTKFDAMQAKHQEHRRGESHGQEPPSAAPVQ